MTDFYSENKTDGIALKDGLVPSSPNLVQELSTGVSFLSDFIKQQYLEEFIPSGGSKIKFAAGRAGSGKTHFARLNEINAKEAGFLVASFSAKEVWLHDFREVYLEILRQCNLESILHDCADQIIREMGYDPSQIEPGKTFMDFLSEKQEADALSKGTIRSILRSWFTKNPLLDNMFAGACSLLTGSILGHPVIEPAGCEIIYSFLHGDKTIKLTQMRALGISPSRITKYNARHMLRSLSEVIHLSGKAGLLVVIDDLDVLMNRSTAGSIRYTKLRREDTYESIRQLIDDIDSMRYVMFLFCLDRDLMDNESFGLKSYQALWMRIQSEVVGSRFNRFADILDLDRLGDQIYSEEVLIQMSEKLCRVLERFNLPGRVLTADEAKELIRRSEYGGIGLPYLVNRAVQSELKGNGMQEERANGGV